MTTAAKAAAEIRKRLKVAGIKASVTSSNYSGGNSVDIALTDAPPNEVKRAKAICAPFQYGHFDGMIDSYEYSNKRTDLPAQVEYVFVKNRTSSETEQLVYDFVRSYFEEARDFPPKYDDAINLRMADGWVPQFVWSQFCQADSPFWNFVRESR